MIKSKLIKNWIIVIDKLWNQCLNTNNLECKVIKQNELSKINKVDSIYSLNSEFEILNLTSLNNLDIKFLLGISMDTNTNFIEIYEQ